MRRAHSQVVRRGIRIAEARIRFPLGPPLRPANNCRAGLRGASTKEKRAKFWKKRSGAPQSLGGVGRIE